jgi:iron(III) transport system permease protein
VSAPAVMLEPRTARRRRRSRSRRRSRTRRRFPVALTALGALVVAGLLLPLAFLVLQASQVGWSQIWSLLGRSLVASLLWNTVRLAVAVTVLCAVIGTAAAWLTERTNLPLRRVLSVVLILPVVIPDFVVAWSWSSIFPAVHGYLGAVLVMTLGLYPLVYLPMAAAFRSADPAQEEVGRSLGLSRARAWYRVSLRQARSTLLGGCLLVCLALLAEYGAFENLRYQTFTTAIFTELDVSFATAAACALSLVLVLCSVLVLLGEAAFRERGRLQHTSTLLGRYTPRHRLGRATPIALAGTLLLAGFGLGFPLAVVCYWLAQGATSTLPATESVASAAGYSALYSAVAAGIATCLSLPVTLLAVRRRARWTAALERSAFVVQALPGLVIALALVYATTRYASSLYESPLLLIVAYSMMFFPLAIVAVRASVARAPEQLEEIGRSLGSGPIRVRLEVTLPLVAPGLAAAFCLVFVSAVTELTATLLLVPTNVQTLATQFWAYTENVSYGAAAPYAAAMIGMAIVPGYLLSRFFDRRGRRSGGGPVSVEAVGT